MRQMLRAAAKVLIHTWVLSTKSMERGAPLPKYEALQLFSVFQQDGDVNGPAYCWLKTDDGRATVGRLQMQLVFFQGGLDTPLRCLTSEWTSDPARFAQVMAKVKCAAGYTRITRALEHAKTETTREKVGAVVLIGDACEPVENNIDRVCRAARDLGQLKTPVFSFLEGYSPQAETGFRKVAELSSGAFGRFDAGGVKQLEGLLKTVAAFAVGGAQALEGRQDEASMLLLEQMRRNG
jgi:hypothetical protein